MNYFHSKLSITSRGYKATRYRQYELLRSLKAALINILINNESHDYVTGVPENYDLTTALSSLL